MSFAMCLDACVIFLYNLSFCLWFLYTVFSAVIKDLYIIIIIMESMGVVVFSGVSSSVRTVSPGANATRSLLIHHCRPERRYTAFVHL